MKKQDFIASVLFMFILFGCAHNPLGNYPKHVPYSKSNPLNKENIAKNLYIGKDDFQKTVFVTPETDRDNCEELKDEHGRCWEQNLKIEPYVGIGKGGHKYYRLRLTYKGIGWLFMNRLHIMCENGYEYKKDFGFFKVERDTLYSEWIEEKIDYVPTPTEVYKLSKCRSGRVRLSGKKGIKEQRFTSLSSTLFEEARFVWKKIRRSDIDKLISLKEKLEKEKSESPKGSKPHPYNRRSIASEEKK